MTPCVAFRIAGRGALLRAPGALRQRVVVLGEHRASTPDERLWTRRLCDQPDAASDQGTRSEAARASLASRDRRAAVTGKTPAAAHEGVQLRARPMPCDTSHRPDWLALYTRAATIVESYDTPVTLCPLFHRLVPALLKWFLSEHKGGERLSCAAAVRLSLAAESRAGRSRNTTGARDDGWDFLGAGL
jgi:hypothetical protein